MQMFNRDMRVVEPLERSEDEWLESIRSLYNSIRVAAASGQCLLDGQSVDEFMDGPGGVLSKLSGMNLEQLRELDYAFGLQKVKNVHDLMVLCDDIGRSVRIAC